MSLCQDANNPALFPLVAATWDGVCPGRARRRRHAAVTQALKQATATARVDFQVLCRLPGEAYVLAGRLEEARLSLRIRWRSPVSGRNAATRRCPAPARRHCGAARSPGKRAGESPLHQALALADEFGMRPLQAHCHRGLGTLYLKIGWREQARAALSAAIEMYRTMDMTFGCPRQRRRWHR